MRNHNPPLDAGGRVIVEYDQDDTTQYIPHFPGKRHPAVCWKVLSPCLSTGSTSTSPAIHQPTTALGRCEQSARHGRGLGSRSVAAGSRDAPGHHTPNCHLESALASVMLGAKMGQGNLPMAPRALSDAKGASVERDELYQRFLATEWGDRKACTACPDGHPACFHCGGVKPGLTCKSLIDDDFGHQRYIQGGDYPEDCVYTEVEDCTRWTLEGIDREAESQRLRAICKEEGHEQGEEGVSRYHMVTVALTPNYKCLRCGVTYTGKKRAVSPEAPG